MASGKVCTKCGVMKPLDGFHRKKGRVDGRSPHCKECVREYSRRYHKENLDKERKRSRRYYEENRDKVREYQRRWSEENRGKVRERNRSYYEENREKVLDRHRRYNEENRDIINQDNKSRYTQSMRASTLLADRKGTPYSPQEDALLLANNGMTVYQKSITLGRTYQSCRARRQLLRSREAVDV